jgi:uncharacterized membrane protein YbaN (DUF454 family)
MKSVSNHKTLALECVEPGQEIGAYPSLEIEFDERAGSVRVYDPRLFQAGRRGFCERLLLAAARQPGICKAEIDLASASCRIEFCAGSQAPRLMADSFVGAVRDASAGCSFFDRFALWRRPRQWSALTAFRLPEGPSLWESVEVEPAQIRLRRPGVVGHRARLSRLADTLAEIEGVDACRVSPWSRQITIDVGRDSPLSDRFLDTVEQALACLNAGELLGTTLVPQSAASDESAVAAGGKRLWYLAMAGGAFSLTLVGLVVPGIPTVPFLLATSYYLARSSPRLNERLRRTSFFGPILREWEEQGGVSRVSKGKLTGLTLAIVGITIILAPLTPVTLLVILIISSLSIYGISRMPEIADDRPGEPQLGEPARLALPAP